MHPATTFLAVFRFHLASSIRVTVRLLMPLIVVYAVLVGFFGPDLLMNLRRILFPQPPTWIAASILTACCYAVARQGAALLLPGRSSWLRHLPISSRSHTLSATAALLAAQSPLLVGFLAMASLRLTPEGEEPRTLTQGTSDLLIDTTGLMLLALACAYAATLRGEGHRLAWIVALAAAVCAGTTSLPGLAAAFPLMAFALALASLIGVRGRPQYTRAAPRSAAQPEVDGWSARLPFSARLVWRSCGARLLSGWPAAAMPIAASLFFVLNNDLPRRYTVLGLRLGVALALAMTVLHGVTVVQERRPRWPWARSLPVSSAQRVSNDAIALATLGLAPLIPGALLSGEAVLVFATSLPLLAVLATRGAGTVASTGADRSRGPGAFAYESFCFALLVSLVPWSAALVVVLPVLLRRAASRDRLASVGTFAELQHRADGDTLTWSNR